MRKKETVRNTNTWRLNNTFLNNQQVTEEIKGEIYIYINKWQWKQDNSKSMGCSKSSSKREVYSNAILTQETRIKHWIDSLNLHLKQLEKEEGKNKLVEGKKA